MEILCSIKSEDKQEIRELYEVSFSDSVDFMNYYFQDKFLSERVMAIRADSKIVSMLHLNPFIVHFNGDEYNVSYIVAVATAVEYRNKGYMGKLIKSAMNRLYNAGEVFSLLMPIDSRIYERYGFGFVEDHLKFECNSATFTIEPIKYSCRIAEIKDLPILVSIFYDFKKQFNLSTCRNEVSFEMLFHELQTDNGNIIIFENGYMMTYYEKEIFHVREFVSNNSQAFNEMIAYIKKETHDGRVVIMDHVRSPIKHITPNVAENIIKLQPFMMARIIHVEAFLKANHFLFMNDIRIKVIDAIIEENNCIFHINNGEVSKEVDSKFEIELDVKLLTQLAFGYMKTTEIEAFREKKIIKDILPNHFFNEYV